MINTSRIEENILYAKHIDDQRESAGVQGELRLNILFQRPKTRAANESIPIQKHRTSTL